MTWEESHDPLPPRVTGEEARTALGLGDLTPQQFVDAYSPIEGMRANSTHTRFKVGLTLKP
ncbi:MAG: hypothetical protein GY788_20265 [bacterium]|nr:hypothetical protein [bacterium]